MGRRRKSMRCCMLEARLRHAVRPANDWRIGGVGLSTIAGCRPGGIESLMKFIRAPSHHFRATLASAM